MLRKSDKATHKDSFALPRVYRLHFLDLASRANKQLQTVGSPKYQADNKRNSQSVKPFLES